MGHLFEVWLAVRVTILRKGFGSQKEREAVKASRSILSVVGFVALLKTYFFPFTGASLVAVEVATGWSTAVP